MAYVKDREGSVDGLVDFWSERLAGLSMEAPGGGVEAALLGLLLNVEAIGGQIGSRAVNPEGAEILVQSLPGERVSDDIEDRFEVSLTGEDLLAVLGITREELNRLLDVFGYAAAKGNFEFRHESDDGAERLNLRVW